MDQATQLWGWWLSLLSAFAPVFTRPGWVRFVQWVTGMVLCWKEHTLTQILTAVGLESRWRVLEHFAEYGVWDREAVERQTLRLIVQEQPGPWGCYHPVAIDDTKGHRTSKQVWGTCTFHEASARSPNRAETVRAHHWVVMGNLVPGHPWLYWPMPRGCAAASTSCPPASHSAPRRLWPQRCCGRPRPSRCSQCWQYLMGPTRWTLWCGRVWSPVLVGGGWRS